MSNPIERYQKLGLSDSLTVIFRYPLACEELSFILRGAYDHVPKNLQSLIFQDTLTAFRLLPEMQASNAVSAAHLLLKSAEASLPKQKRNLAVAEYKHAMVAQRRRSKANQEIISSPQLPLDVLVHIFSFLDISSLLYAQLVCWSWNLAASDNHLWHSKYSLMFGNSGDSSKNKVPRDGRSVKETHALSAVDILSQTNVDWKEAFKRAYIASSSISIKSSRGYCGQCNAVVWLNNFKCSNGSCILESKNGKIKPISPEQVVKYVLDNETESESEGETETEFILRWWAYV